MSKISKCIYPGCCFLKVLQFINPSQEVCLGTNTTLEMQSESTERNTNTFPGSGHEAPIYAI